METKDALKLHNKLLYQTTAIDYLSQEVNNGKDLRRFRGNCRNYITTPVGIASKTCEELLEELEKMGEIKVGHYKGLKELVSFDDRLVQEIKYVERAMNMKVHKETSEEKKAGNTEGPAPIDELLVKVDMREIYPLENEKYDEVLQRLMKISRKMLEIGDELYHDPVLYKEYIEKCLDFQERTDESAKLLWLFYYKDDEDKTKFGEQVIKIAEEGQRRIDTEDFSICIENWKRHSQLLKGYLNTFFHFIKKGAEVRKLLFGSIYVFLLFESREKLKIFISEYRSGVLQQELQEILITEEFLECFRLKSAKIEISIELEEYLSNDDGSEALLRQTTDESKAVLRQTTDGSDAFVLQTTDESKAVPRQTTYESEVLLRQTTDESEVLQRQTTDESKAVPRQTTDGSDAFVLQTTDEIEAILRQTTDESEVLLRQTTDESEALLRQTTDGSEPLLGQTTDESEDLLRQTTDGSKALLWQTTDGSEALLRQTTDESNAVLRQTTDGSEDLLRQTTDGSEPLLRQTTDERETLLRQTTDENEALHQQKTDESEAPLQQTTDQSEAPLRQTADEIESYTVLRKTTDEKLIEISKGKEGNLASRTSQNKIKLLREKKKRKQRKKKLARKKKRHSVVLQQRRESQNIKEEAPKIEKHQETDDQTTGVSMEYEGPDMSQLRKRLIEINEETIQDIPLSPLQEGGDEEMPIELLYASVVIREDPKYARKGNDSPQHRRADPKGKSISGGNVAKKGQNSAWKRSHQISNISMTPEFDIGSYNYDSDSDKGSTLRVSDEFLTTYAPLSSSFRFPDAVSRHTREVTNPDDILKKDGKVARNIYMLGDAAHGKTTYCTWLLKKWCNAQLKDKGGKELDKWEKALHEFDFVFLLQFRYVNPNLASVIDMICQDVFHRDTGYHAAIRHVLSSDEYRSLIIMDGLDEWNSYEETRKQLTCNGMPNIPVSSSVSCFFSMRPWVFPTISKNVKTSDRVIEILGLSETGMEKVVENVLLNRCNLKDDPSKYTAIYDKIVRRLEDKSLKSFMRIPLLALFCVQMWYKETQVRDGMTNFYAVMVDILIERAYEKHELKTIPDKTLDRNLPHILSETENVANHISVLLKLGKVAYEGLLSNETNLVFQKRKLQKEIGERELQFALDVGLISQKEAPSLVSKNVSVHFFHKSFQEFLAVIYIVTKKEVRDSFCKHLSNVNVIMELSNVIMFICGMCPSLGSVISQHVVSVTDSDTEICQYRESPKYNSKVEELYKVQLSWYRELQYGQTNSQVTQTDIQVTKTDSHVTQTDSSVTFYVSDIYLTKYSDTETVRVTRELLSDHHVDIRSLYLLWVTTDGEHGIPNKELDDFLSNTDKTKSLVALYIHGRGTDRSVPVLSLPTLRYLCLQDVTLNTHLDDNVYPPLLIDMRLLRELRLDNVTLGEGGLGLSPDMVHIEKIHLSLVNLGEGGLGLSPDMVHLETVMLISVNMKAAGWGELILSLSNTQHEFNAILYMTNIDDVSVTMIRSSPDFTVTRDDLGVLYFTRVWPPSQLTHDDDDNDDDDKDEDDEDGDDDEDDDDEDDEEYELLYTRV